MVAKNCSVDGCDGVAITRGWCQNHYRRWMKYGRLDRVYHENQSTKCSKDGCDAEATRKGLCRPHYKEVQRQNPKLARAHKQYSLWHDRKSQGLLCAEWLDFFTFIRAIGERPSPRHALTRKHRGLYGPNNFQWRETLRRREDESKKDWYARKWQARKVANPGWGRRRDMFRKYGIQIDEYDLMLKAQGDVCAICHKPETRLDPSSGNLSNLAVDHCHKTKKVRGLLCYRCNTTIGKVHESIELLRAMEVYLQHHQDDYHKEPPP